MSYDIFFFVCYCCLLLVEAISLIIIAILNRLSFISLNERRRLHARREIVTVFFSFSSSSSNRPAALKSL
jgi:hypothetical protein